MLFIGVISVAGCVIPQFKGDGSDHKKETITTAAMSAASKYCVDHGGRILVVENASGEYTLCEFPNGVKCEELAYYRGECSAEKQNTIEEQLATSISENQSIQDGGNAQAEGFCGSSTEAPCRSNDDCQRGGCNSQICQAKSEGIILSSCDKPCYKPEPYGLKCGCVEGKCKWHK